MKNGWPIVRAGDVLQLQRRWIKVDPLEEYVEIGVRSYGRGIFHKQLITGASLGDKRVLRICPGDLVFMNVFAWEGAVGVAGPAEDGKIGSHRFATFTPKNGAVDPRFVQLYFQTEAGRELLGRVSPGSAGRNRTMNLAQFAEQLLPRPPIDEQQEIVAWIEALSAKIVQARAIAESSTNASNAVCQSARRLSFEAMCKGRTAKPLGDVADCRLGKMLWADNNLGVSPAPYLRNANIRNDAFNLSSVYQMDFRDDEKPTFELQPGDLLINEGGYGVGRCAVWQGQIRPCYFQKSLHRVRVDQSLIAPRFLMHHMLWANEAGHFADITRTTTFQHLTGVRLKKYMVYLPPLAEQQRIVAYLDGLSAKAESLKSLQQQSAAEIDALLPSILDKAFKGEL